MTEGQIVGFILLILGGLQAARPDIFMRFQIWTQKVIMGAEYVPSNRTYNILRSIGVSLFIIGLLALTGAIE